MSIDQKSERKDIIMEKGKRILLVILCVLMIIPVLSMDVGAATQRQRAMAAYKKWLNKNYICVLKPGTWVSEDYVGDSFYYSKSKASNVRFATAYIDGDSVPELVVYTKVGYNDLFAVFTYKNGKVCRVYSDGELWNSLKGYYKKTGYIFVKYHSEGSPYTDLYYRMYGTRVRNNFRKWSNGFEYADPERLEVSYYVGNQQVSKTTFMTKIRKAVRYQKKTNFQFYQNTAANRRAKLR